MISRAEYACECCNRLFTARTADRERGWAQYCSKTCKAIHQEHKKKMWRVLTTYGNKSVKFMA